MSEVDGYGLSEIWQSRRVEAPDLPYRPRDPEGYRPGIGVVGCGGISAHHLNAYRTAGYEVVALCDRNPEKVEARGEEYFPAARRYLQAEDLLRDPRVEVVDLTPHAAEREAMTEAALRAGKHVLCQKPFVLDSATGERLARLAKELGLKLAVNQNGRWAPHFSYARQAVEKGLLGRLSSIDISMQFDHNWTAGTPFERIHHLILFDFAIHWFDILQAFTGEVADRVFASVARSASQRAKPPLLAHVLVDYPSVQATLRIDGDTRLGQSDRTVLVGENGTLVSEGPGLNEQRLTLFTAEGHAIPRLEGAWFDDGFHGAMAELLSAIAEDREPENGAAGNLPSLQLCFAAIASADSGEPVRPGEVLSLPASVFAPAG